MVLPSPRGLLARSCGACRRKPHRLVRARLRTPQKIAVLHYSPIQATVTGEPPEIVAFLGSSRLKEPIDRYRANAVFHGHAHRGSAEGRTKNGAPVYNVAMPVLAAAFPERPTFRVIEVPLTAEAVA